MGIVQHHDAISGTERQDVADDYAQRLSQGIDAALVSENNFMFLIFFKNININRIKYIYQKMFSSNIFYRN